MMINQPNPNESMMPVRVEADLEEIPKPPVVTRREINFLHTLFLSFFLLLSKNIWSFRFFTCFFIS